MITKNNYRKKMIIRRLLLSLGIVVAFCVVIFIWKRNYIPTWVKWQEKRLKCGQCELVIKKKRMSVLNDSGEQLFLSDKSIKFQDAITTDVDGDGLSDIVAVVWKRGLFGKHRPFWVKTDEKDYSQHVFIYGVDEEGKVSQKWFASETGILINRMKLMDKHPQIILFEDIDGACSLWKWESFGLKNIENKVSFVAFGDNIIHDAIIEAANKEHGGKYDFLYEPFLNEIQSADIAAFNSETVLVDKESMVSGYPSFGAPIAVGEALADAGFNIAVCANNHALDKGLGALEYTKAFYEEQGLKCLGTQKRADAEYRPYEVMSRNGINIALFAYTYGTNMGDISTDYPYVIHYLPREKEDEELLRQSMTEAKSEADIIVVFVHWGEEYELKANDEQRKMATLLADAGADVIIGSHPHVVQEMEVIKRADGGETLTFYSLGNFRADQGFDDKTKAGGEAVFTLEHTYDGARISDYELKEIDAFWKSE